MNGEFFRFKKSKLNYESRCLASYSNEFTENGLFTYSAHFIARVSKPSLLINVYDWLIPVKWLPAKMFTFYFMSLNMDVEYLELSERSLNM